jgi:hypothetical protein
LLWVDVFCGAISEIPRINDRQAIGSREQLDEIELALDAQQVHIAPDVDLMAEIAEDVEACHQRIVDSLELRVVDPGRDPLAPAGV